MSLGVIVQDNAIQAPEFHHATALRRRFVDYAVGQDVFRGVTHADAMDPFDEWLCDQGFYSNLAFFRRSEVGQHEPHYIHHDAMMGDWTAILYLNPQPHPGDGTIFWEHNSGKRGIDVVVADDVSQFTERFRVKAQFNRAVIFPSHWFHSRALFENYGTGDGARLIQVAFGRVA